MHGSQTKIVFGKELVESRKPIHLVPKKQQQEPPKVKRKMRTIDKLLRLQRYYEKAMHCNEYAQKINARNNA
jgi:hypothetical protein